MGYYLLSAQTSASDVLCSHLSCQCPCPLLLCPLPFVWYCSSTTPSSSLVPELFCYSMNLLLGTYGIINSQLVTLSKSVWQQQLTMNYLLTGVLVWKLTSFQEQHLNNVHPFMQKATANKVFLGFCFIFREKCRP